MTFRPDQINAGLTTFNERTQLFNSDGSPIISPVHYVEQIRETTIIENQLSSNSRPKVLRDVGSLPEDLPDDKVTDSSIDVPREILIGSFAGIRAARVLHQHSIGFWSDAGIIDTTTSTTKADPSAATTDELYQKFLVFSYLPSAITPSAEEFADLVAPSKAGANVQNALSNIGINLATRQTQDLGTFQDPVIGQTLPDPVPFANSLSQFCSLL